MARERPLGLQQGITADTHKDLVTQLVCESHDEAAPLLCQDFFGDHLLKLELCREE